MNKRIYISKVSRILIIKWSALGDVAMATSVLEDVVQALPNAKIDLNVMPAYAELFKEDGRFSEIFSFDLRKKDRGIIGILKWLKKVKKNKYDIVLDFQGVDRSRLLLMLWRLTSIKVPLFVGYSPIFPYKLTPQKINRKPRGVENLRRMVETIGIVTNKQHPVIKYTEQRDAKVRDILIKNNIPVDNYIILVPGSQADGYLKRWGFTNYSELSKSLYHKYGLKSVLVGGPDDIDECEKTYNLSKASSINLCGTTEILDLVPLAKMSKIIIANDTGPGHIMAAANKPMITICGPTDPVRVKPLGAKVKTMQAEVECKNCYLRTCKNDHICMKSLTVDQVVREVFIILDNSARL